MASRGGRKSIRLKFLLRTRQPRVTEQTREHLVRYGVFLLL
jgi:hypothetical protein